MPTIRLTNTSVQALPLVEKGTAWYYDVRLKGFCVGVGSQKKTYYVSKSLRGRNIRVKIGDCDAMPCDAARKEAVGMASDISRGLDPRRRRDATLQSWLDDYIETYTHLSHDRLSAGVADQYRRVLKNHCASWLNRDLRLMTEADIQSLHQRLRSRPSMANQLIRVLRSIQRHAGIPVPPKFQWFKKGERRMDILDLAVFREQVLSIENASRRAVWLLAVHTGIRRQNLLELEWENVDLDGQALHLTRMKNRLARTMPLSDQAAAVLRSMKGLHKKWVFPSFDGGEHLVEVRDEKVPYVFHNTRRVFTQACASCLLPKYAINYLRGDKGQTIEEHYISELDLADAIKRVGTYLEAKMMPKKKALEAVG